MSIYKRGSIFWAKFMVKGEMHYASCETGNRREAEGIEARMRSEVLRGNFGILKPQRAMTLREFFEKHFLPHVDGGEVEATRKYYHFGAEKLLAHMGDVGLDQVTSEHATGLVSKYKMLSKASQNCVLRTLRRAVRLAVEWQKLDKAPVITLVTGERKRERVVKDLEFTVYIAACKQPWRDIAVLLRGAGVRPGEAYGLRWENVLFSVHGGQFQITKGKTSAAKRLLPMVPEVRTVLKNRHESAGRPEDGWVFPSTENAGHVSPAHCSVLHRQALKASGVAAFEPYCLRHTALTRLAESGCDSFTLARIAGHTSITMTMRYIHPQEEAINAAFERVGTERKALGTILGTGLEKA